MHTTIETITPEKAAAILHCNECNRPLTNAVVESYARQMKEGKWLSDGAPIRFSKTGRLMDGQHRLHAVIKSGATIDAVLVHGLEDGSFKTMDTGRKRTAGDVLGIAGFTDTNRLAAIAGSYFYYVNHGSPHYRGGSLRVTNEQVLHLCKTNRFIHDAHDKARQSKWLRNHLPSMAIGSLYVAACMKGESEAVNSFFDQLASPTTETIGTPIMLLRERLIEQKACRDKWAAHMAAAYTFKAYRDYRDGKTPKILKMVLDEGSLNKGHYSL